MKTEWTTKLYEYQIRTEHDDACEPPWENYDGQLCTVEHRHHWAGYDFGTSGEHNQEAQKTWFWDLLGNGWTIHIDLTAAARKYIEFMGKPRQGRYNLVQWIKRNLEAEGKEARHYLNGDCWGYIVERRAIGSEDKWEHASSCWGLIGDDPESVLGEYVDPDTYTKADEETWMADAIGAGI